MKKSIAITGGIGSGKSAVLAIIRDMGREVISADNVNRELLQDRDYLSILEDNFKEAFPDGVFDKRILADIIFNNDDKRLLLNSIAHKRIKILVKDKIAISKDDFVYVEVPLLVESGMADLFDDIIVVTADTETKIERVAIRDNISKEDVVKRIASQLSDAELLKYATYIINNDCDLGELRCRVELIVKEVETK